MAGYSGNVVLLYLGPNKAEGVAGPSMLRATGTVALCNVVVVCLLYLLEARHERARAPAHLAEPLLPPEERGAKPSRN